MTSSLRGACAALGLVACALGLSACGAGDGGRAAPESPAAAAATAAVAPPSGRGPSVLRGSVALIDGTSLRLPSLQGSVVLAVNTASRCGYTPQFEGLESLYASQRAAGLTIVGFPSNDFNQELAGDGEIKEFCTLNYGVSFPMAARSRVTGPKANPLFAAIAARPAPAGEEPSWNFTKYLIDRSGRLVARYPSSVEPDDPELRAAVDRLLAEDPGL